MKKELVYIASPYTVGDKLENVRLQIDAWHMLRDAGMVPIAPLLTHYMEEVRHRDYEDWLDYDFSLISICQKVVRLRPHFNGVERPSSGADREQEEATRLGIEFLSFDSLEELKEQFILKPAN